MTLPKLVSRLVLRPSIFIALCVVAIVLTRATIILVIPRTADLPDLRIYQAAGQAVLAGVNPYDFTDQPALRESLRASVATPAEPLDFAQSLDSWNYYVSSNLPASTALYAAFERLSGGSRPAWRWGFILGDIAILFGLLALLRALRLPLDEGAVQLGVMCLAVVNPVLMVSGCAIPEDKQFQTALLLSGAALLLAASAQFLRALLTGVVLSLGVLFKFFGVFLFPLWLAAWRAQGWRFAAWSIAGGLIPLAISFAWFGRHFIETMTARGVSNSIQGPEHASPWVFAASFAGDHYLLLKVVVVAAFCGTMLWRVLRKRIDLLNVCAALTVAFACLWLDKGAMNRMNIAMLFAMAALASMSVRLFVAFALGGMAVSGLAYAIGVGVLHHELVRVDALLVTLFVLAYWLTLALGGSVRSAAGSSPTAAAAGSPA